MYLWVPILDIRDSRESGLIPLSYFQRIIACQTQIKEEIKGRSLREQTVS